MLMVNTNRKLLPHTCIFLLLLLPLPPPLPPPPSRSLSAFKRPSNPRPSVSSLRLLLWEVLRAHEEGGCSAMPPQQLPHLNRGRIPFCRWLARSRGRVHPKNTRERAKEVGKLSRSRITMVRGCHDVTRLDLFVSSLRSKETKTKPERHAERRWRLLTRSGQKAPTN